MTKRSIIIARGVGTVGAVAALITGATFAALQTSVTLSDNTISTATANLLVFDGSSFQTTGPGFHVTGLVPGTASTPAPFYLKNSGGVDLALTASVNPQITPTNGMDPFKIHIQIKDTATDSGDVANTTLGALETGNVLFDTNLPAGSQGDSSTAGTNGNYTYSVEIDNADVPTGGTSVPSFNLIINGTQVGV